MHFNIHRFVEILLCPKTTVNWFITAKIVIYPFKLISLSSGQSKNIPCSWSGLAEGVLSAQNLIFEGLWCDLFGLG